jgi:hypothetical protein
MQAPFEEDRTWQSTMALLSGEGETHLPIVSSHVRPMRTCCRFNSLTLANPWT